jgi:hypothetical protein
MTELTNERLRITTPGGATASTVGHVMDAAYTAKGTILAGSAAGAPTTFALAGTNGYVLSADSTTTTGFKWVSVAGGGDMSKATYDPDLDSRIALAQLYSDVAGTADITTHASSTNTHIGGAGTVLSVAAATVLITTHAGSTDAHIGGAGTVLSTAAATILIKTHSDLTAGIHGVAAGSTIATTAEIATHAGLTATHGAGTILSVAAGTALITTHAGSTDAHIGGAGTVLSTAAATALITTHAALTTEHGVPNLLPKQMIENDPLKLDAVLSATGKYCGITETGVSGTVLAFGDVAYLLAASTRWMKTLANTATTANGKLGVALGAATAAADTIDFLLFGKVSASSFPSLPIGAPIFLSAGTVGYVTGTASAGTTGYTVRIVGYGNSATELAFQPDNTWIEVV